MAVDPGITDIARQLAEDIPTGPAKSPEQTVQDWRSTIYNAKSTASLRPLADLIERSAPHGNPRPGALAEVLRRK
ncbi:MAG: hypothetical protein H6737_21250 [Alphaproteobacteria bacterium]|nr:hypothetical protein [Alphaproteobacteria bacterium]